VTNHLLFAPLAVAVTTLMTAGCGPDPESCGPNSICLQSRLLVDACAGDPDRSDFIGGIADCRADFGAVEAAAHRTIVLTNQSPLDIALDISVQSPVGAPVAAFFLDAEPPTIVTGGNFRVEIALTAIPIAPGAAVATLEIVTDADNVLAEGDDTISVELLASVPDPASEP